MRAFSLILTPTVCDAAPSVTISIDDASVTEGDSGTVNATFHVSLSAASAQTVTVAYATAPGTATATTDYKSKALTTLTFMPGQTSKPVTIAVKGDTNQELDETFFVNLSAPSNATIADSQGVGTIRNNDPAPAASIADKAVVEGNTGTKNLALTVRLSGTTFNTVTLNYQTADAGVGLGFATAGADYVAKSGTLTFTPGQKSKTITVSIKGDLLVEGNEVFNVKLTGASNATIADGQAVATITNND